MSVVDASVRVDEKGVGHIDRDPSIDIELDYPFRFGNWLAVGDTITAVLFTPSTGLTVTDFSIEDDALVDPAALPVAIPTVRNTTASLALVTIKNQTAITDTSGQVVCRATTANGLVYERTLKFKFRDF